MRDEVEKVRQMSLKEKWKYFKAYYLVQTVIGFILLILAAFFIHDMKLSNREILASGCFVNVTIDGDGFLFLTDEYIKFCDKSAKDATALLSIDNTLDFMPENPLDKNSYEMALTTQMVTGEFQYMILDETAWEHLQQTDTYADLTQILTPSQQEEYAERMIYQQRKGQAEIATALNLSETEFSQRYHLEPQTAYLVFLETAQEKDTESTIEKKRQLIDYIMHGSF